MAFSAFFLALLKTQGEALARGVKRELVAVALLVRLGADGGGLRGGRGRGDGAVLLPPLAGQ